MFIGREPRGIGIRWVRPLVKLSNMDCAASKSPSNRLEVCRTNKSFAVVTSATSQCHQKGVDLKIDVRVWRE
jgi:hypothetical protein